ncbi:cupin domain-containing protein [Nocardia sp. NBC_00508]|uniref:cupin domain-containing protein n=1 Tax=Nocardia sp. NBC_00508 TaxID=2975992 RepID=UPI002E81FF9D|nr:cupin domain-containing protein [Nocardia sp. NBC_00508]WUD66298.1 cupin domain-containing protein [Nocardia sp. NBC_00508]
MSEIRRLDRAGLTEAYGVATERLLPWAVLNAPFEGAWCVLGPGGVSEAHAHHEYELFIAMSGRATLDVDGERREFLAGDLAHLVPGTTHHVRNVGDADFEWYAIWWDTEMSARFLARHENNGDRS